MPRRWRWHGRKGRRKGRPPSKLLLQSTPEVKKFVPEPCQNSEPVELTYPEYNVLRSLDLKELTQKEVAKKMKTSQATIWRLYKSARKKIITALDEGRPLEIRPKGKVEKAEPH